jgi:K(+)-stimulated pyrophosphate-energized sodium pump
MNTLLLPPVLGVVGMFAAALVYMQVMKYPDGEDKVKKIGDQIHAGALAFMKTEYKYLTIFIVVIVLLAWFALRTLHSNIYNYGSNMFISCWFYWHVCSH